MKIIGISIFAILILAACKKEGCTYPKATNYNSEAEKDDGSCIYEPDEPVDPREKFLGAYSVKDSIFYSEVFDHVTPYSMNVTTGDTKSDTLYFNNWGNFGHNYLVLVSGTNFSIPSNSFPGNIKGNGSFGTNELTYTGGDFSGFTMKGLGTK